MDTRFITVCLMLWATYRPCSTVPNPWIKTNGLERISDEDNAREEGNSAVTSPPKLPDTTTEVISAPVEHGDVSDDSSFGHHHANCCQDGYMGRMMRDENGHMMGSDNGHMVGRLSRHMMGRRNWDTMRQHKQIGRWSSSRLYTDHMQDVPEDESKEVDQSGSIDKEYQGVIGDGHSNMMQGYYGMSDEGVSTRGARRDYRGHRTHRRGHERPVAAQNND